ncbi:MAG: hypothetical protein PHU46_17260, partial [Rhodocyclaceae bacterium]|nr:hypothetical protein [Rhodocyclaceae bacterium]
MFKFLRKSREARNSPRQWHAASLSRRLSSMLYESMLMLGVLSVTFIAPYLLLGVFWKVSVSGAVEWLHLFLVMGTYFVWYWRRNGQTLSMQ